MKPPFPFPPPPNADGPHPYYPMWCDAFEAWNKKCKEADSLRWTLLATWVVFIAALIAIGITP